MTSSQYCISLKINNFCLFPSVSTLKYYSECPAKNSPIFRPVETVSPPNDTFVATASSVLFYADADMSADSLSPKPMLSPVSSPGSTEALSPCSLSVSRAAPLRHVAVGVGAGRGGRRPSGALPDGARPGPAGLRQLPLRSTPLRRQAESVTIATRRDWVIKSPCALINVLISPQHIVKLINRRPFEMCLLINKRPLTTRTIFA